MPARVTINAGIPMYATQKPCHIPTSAPTAIAASIAAHHGSLGNQSHPLCCNGRTAKIPDIAPIKHATEPTERSMCPAIMIITMPIARTRMYPFCTTRFDQLSGVIDARFGVVKAKKPIKTSSAIKIPFWRRSTPSRRLRSPSVVLDSLAFVSDI